jgi:hypothetical protein
LIARRRNHDYVAPDGVVDGLFESLFSIDCIDEGARIINLSLGLA